ncbi:hypothetical protein BD324DRAFT_631360 [Kockovaella imperatae]|uniref:DUF7719 domain-containing protein n=1 Tax=Kockovaella imperatae TaxID=4999 RepID=A0A1Y1UDX0_9TREE|nr:hypothetical protein BD324DRAFT_631360 [Kockovaella imperatae]ORX35714.1 hypothetical protein BD324DRAFT_631360 [Kockovaella imperatae]
MAVVEDVPDESEIPLKHPSEIRNQSAREPLVELSSGSNLRQRRVQAGADSEDVEHDEEELKAVDANGSALKSIMTGGEDVTPEWFDIGIMTVPFVFLYLLLDILVHLQYQHRPTVEHLTMNLIKAVPTLGVIMYYTTKHSSHFLTNSLLMSASVISGCRLIWLVNMAGWSLTTDQAPAMGTIWILTIVQLPLSRALIALGIVAGWTKYAGMKISP